MLKYYKLDLKGTRAVRIPTLPRIALYLNLLGLIGLKSEYSETVVAEL